MIQKLLKKWHLFCYGDPCKHGVFGLPYVKGYPWIIGCEECIQDIDPLVNNKELDYYLDLMEHIYRGPH